MTYEFEYLMHLFACGARGLTPDPPCRTVDYDRLVRLAGEQTVLPLVGAALSGAPDTCLPEEKRSALLDTARSMALLNYYRRRQILKLLRDFDKAGIEAVLLKGYTVAEAYAEPDCRVSSDTDIYVDIRDEKRALKLLREHGCTVVPRSPVSHHAICEHPRMGYIELHVILYDEIVEDVWFQKMDGRQYIQEAYEKHASEEGAYLALGRTDNLIFLALHMIKHFISGGISLRQMMDIALYYKKYETQIDVKRFWNTLGSLKYQNLMNAVLGAMVSYCGFSQDDFAGSAKADGAAVSALLDDLETGGWLGVNEKEERQGSKFRYNRAKYMDKANVYAYWGYMIRRCACCYIRASFPSRAALAKKYPCAGRSAWLVPVAWGRQMLARFRRLLSGKVQTGIVVREGRMPCAENDRTELFRLMRMM